jgi:hypothetical protein
MRKYLDFQNREVSEVHYQMLKKLLIYEKKEVFVFK